VRLPGARRQAAVARAQAQGIAIADALHLELRKLAGRSRAA
jgi:LDH2 family malate/lactate/ureidoglycolate dehydrogenase